MYNIRPAVPERLMDFRDIYQAVFGMDDEKHERASHFFGVSVEECKSWYDGYPHPTAHRYLQVHAKGYLPYNTQWKSCYIRNDGMIVTPYGNCSPSELAFLHRNKWAAEQTRQQLSRYREMGKEFRSGAKLKMLLHTADYLNRLVKELAVDE